MTVAALIVLGLLLSHAVATHGGWFAAIWLGLTTVLGLAVSPTDWTDALLFGEVVYLGGLFAKGFVERTRWKGSIPPFVVAHALFAAWVATPWLLASTRGARALVPCAIGAGLFGLAYRLVSRKTQDDRRKLLVLTLLLPAIILAQGQFAGLNASLWPWAK